MYTISFGDPMDDLLHLDAGVSYSICAKEPDIFFAAIRSLKVHGYNNGYMLQTTRMIR
jgi:hypothetical protein